MWQHIALAADAEVSAAALESSSPEATASKVEFIQYSCFDRFLVIFIIVVIVSIIIDEI